MYYRDPTAKYLNPNFGEASSKTVTGAEKKTLSHEKAAARLAAIVASLTVDKSSDAPSNE